MAGRSKEPQGRPLIWPQKEGAFPCGARYYASVEIHRLNCLIRLIPLLGVLALTGGCDVVNKLRPLFHPDEAPQGLAGNSSLTITIQPAKNIDIYLDGEPVSAESPYTARNLKAERHQLYLEAKGYHPFSLAFDLQANEHLEIPIALRALAPEGPKKAPSAQPRGPGADRGPKTGPGVKPATLTFSTSPPQEIEHMGLPLKSSTVTLDHQWSHLSAGSIQLKFQYNGVGILECSPLNSPPQPDETITWLKNTDVISPGTPFRVPRGSTQVIRFSSISGRQILTIERP